METNQKILALCGSLRQASLNRRLLFHGIEILKEKGCQVTFINLKDLEIPLYNGDDEEKSGLPKGVKELVASLETADGIIIGSPEYNGGITGVLKNTIDWATRAPKNPFFAKPVLLVGTSPGWFGSVKSHSITRLILTHIRAFVMPTQVVVPQGDKAMEENGKLKDPTLEKNLVSACDELVTFIVAQKSQNLK